MILDDLAGALSVEAGSAPLSYFDNNFGGQQGRYRDYSVMGSFKIPGDRIVMALKKRQHDPADTEAEAIVEVTQLSAQFGGGNTLTNKLTGVAGTFGWDLDHPIQGVGYVNAAGQTILVWTDGDSAPKWLNLDNWTGEPNLVFPDAKFPMTRPISFSAQQQNGEILGGSWSFMIAYEVVDGTNNITQYGPAIGSFRIGNVSTDENATYKTNIGLKFYGLDTRYNYARIYGVRNYNGTETVHYCDRIRIMIPDQEWEYLGQVEDETNLPALDELFIPRASYTTAETLTVSDDRLFMANLRSNSVSKAEGEAVANQITMRWTVDQTGRHASQYDNARLGILSSGRVQNYTNDYWVDSIPKRSNDANNYNFRQEQTKLSGIHKHDNFGLLGGFMPDSVYALYIGFLMNDGTWSEAFHIPGGGNDGVHSASNSGFATTSTVTRNMAGDGFTLNFVTCGKLGYVGNANETYPIGYTNGVQGGTLQGAQVRHHRMPTTDQMFAATKGSLGGTDSLNGGTQGGTYSDEWANMHLSLFADNVIIPDELASKIQGWSIFYAKAGINDRRVKGYAPAFAWHRYANLDSSDPLHGTKNITVNALRIYDPYINQTKANNLTDWSVKEVYKNMAYPLSALTGQNSYKESTITDFSYLPNNVNADGYDNSLREAVLAISLAQSPTNANDWMASFPGYFPGNTSGSWANSAFQPSACKGWQGCTSYDSVAYYDNRNSGENGHGGNFASSFGSAHRPGNYTSSGQWYANNAVPDKSSPFYGNTFAQGGGGWKIADTNGTGSSAGLGFAGIGNMMSICELYEDQNQYFENYSAQELVACNDLVHVDGAGTYYSNQAVNGGDTFITPVIIEFMAHRVGIDPDIEPINEQYSEASDDQNNLELGKISYFTYSYLPTELGDLRESENLEYFGDFGSDFGVGSAVNNFFQGQFLNDMVWGSHYYSVNDAKSAFPFNEEGLNVTQFPNRIIRSGKQAYETTQFAWNSFAPADYYDNDLAKEQIRNLEDYKGELIIHHQNAIYKTRSKFTFDASGTDVFVGTGDIFQAPPLELFPDNAGYAGITHWGDSLLCRAGYTWIDREGKKVYLLSQGLEELSANGMRDYFRDDFCNIAGTSARFSDTTDGGGGYAIGYDPKFDRIFYTGVSWAADGTEVRKSGETLSYSLRNKCWASMHDRLPLRYFQSYSSLFFLDEYNMRSWDTVTAAGNHTFLFEQGNGNPGQCTGPVILTPGALPANDETFLTYTGYTPHTKSFVDVVFNMGGPTPKVWQNFNWVTRSGDGEGDLQDNKFENMTVYNDYQISDTVGAASLRKVDNRWNFNNFRDIATGTGSFFTADGHTFDTSRQDNTKTWYNQGRIISEYAIIRLETLNQSGDSLYLTDVSATARKAQR